MCAAIKIGQDLSTQNLFPIVLVNPNDKSWTQHRYILAFGMYGWTRLMVWANSLDDALDEAVDYLREHAPGHISTDFVNEEYKSNCESGMDQEEAWEAATEDMTCAGNYGDYIGSDEWKVIAEDPSREEVLRLLGR